MYKNILSGSNGSTGQVCKYKYEENAHCLFLRECVYLLVQIRTDPAGCLNAICTAVIYSYVVGCKLNSDSRNRLQ